MVKDSSFNSSSTEENLPGSPTCPVTEDMVVQEEAREWKESHKSPISTGFSPKSMSSPNQIMGFTMSPITPVAPKLSPQKPTGFDFSHFKLTDSGLVPFEGGVMENKTLLEHPSCELCNKTFSSTRKLEDHSCEKHRCGECDFRTAFEDAISEHLSEHRSKIEQFKCGMCDQGFKEVHDLEEHCQTFHLVPYKCLTCKLVFVKQDIYEQHTKTACKQVEQCGECDRVFTEVSLLMEHMTRHHTTLSFKPNMTSSITSSASELSLSTQALLLKHSILQKLVANLQNGLQQSQLPTKPIPRFPGIQNCFGETRPPSLFNTPTLLYPTALKAEPLLSAFQPDHLPSLLKSENFLKTENFLKSDNLLKSDNMPVITPLKCTQCTATFSTLDQLHSHLILHQYAAQNRCEECGRDFLNRAMLEEHVRTSHEVDRPFKCTHCDKTFTRSNNLHEHQRTHTGSRPYVCNFCEKSFARSSILHIHMRTHTKIKPFQCTVCPAAFSHSNSLQAHLRRHTGAKPYVCPVCSKAFRQSGTLHRHIRTHNKVKNTLNRPFVEHTESIGENFNMPILPSNYNSFQLLQTLSKTSPTLSLSPTLSPTFLNKENQPDLRQMLQQLQARTTSI